jgi:hypothetical protein
MSLESGMSVAPRRLILSVGMSTRRNLALLAAAGACAVLAGAAWAAGPPRYHACGHVSIGFATPVHAHNVSCAIARIVVKRCSAPKRTCFGEFPLPYNGVGEPDFPQEPAFKPLGFRCYQVWGSYTAGLPPPPTTVRDPKLILCHRDATPPGSNLVIVQQLVAYVV